MRITCPHCGHSASIRTSRAISPLLKEGYAQCVNLDCGHVFKLHVETVATLIPSYKPNPAVHLPQTRRERKAVNG
ncbi:MAG: ogr/Delta-like zinc finger family protein [Betaproteobacteria bacterium]|nr:ogr/Delta-like zinc finger family protein [Betaproteobacteria bacterium]